MTNRRSAARPGHPSARSTRRHHTAVEIDVDEAGHDEVNVGEPTSRRDPLFTRLAVLVVPGILLAPAVASLGNDHGSEILRGRAAIAMAPPLAAASPGGTLPVAAADSAPTSSAPARAVRHSTPRRQRACEMRYTVRRGDYWIGIAERADVKLVRLLRANRATISTALYPRDRICLPSDAREPGPPPTTTQAPPAPIAPAARPAAATPRPASPPPAPPPTTTAPPRRTYGREDVLAIIREVWPDHLEEKAIQVAWRESNWIPTAHNYCCHGLFQIYFNVHRGWLDSFGVTSAQGLYDPRVNAMAAYHLYQRSGGWGPWRQTAG
jgi:hypothetical protein